MLNKARLRAGAVLGAVVLLLAIAAGAAAASGVAPTLGSPNHHRVNPGRIRLVVNIPVKPNKHGVFIAITPKRKLDRNRHLKACFSKRCDFVSPTHWKGHKYSYVAKFNFPGYWAVTPGKYYWQVHYYTVGDTAVYYSTIGSFVVK